MLDGRNSYWSEIVTLCIPTRDRQTGRQQQLLHKHWDCDRQLLRKQDSASRCGGRGFDPLCVHIFFNDIDLQMNVSSNSLRVMWIKENGSTADRQRPLPPPVACHRRNLSLHTPKGSGCTTRAVRLARSTLPANAFNLLSLSPLYLSRHWK